VLAVGAVDHDGVAWYYSASGPELDIVAPSGGTREDYILKGKALLWTTDILGIYGYSAHNLDYHMLDYSDSMSGTSGATPLIAGVAALVLSVDPNLTNMEARRILLDTAVDLGESGNDDFTVMVAWMPMRLLPRIESSYYAPDFRYHFIRR
jgi:subtilisin family serine protease